MKLRSFYCHNNVASGDITKYFEDKEITLEEFKNIATFSISDIDTEYGFEIIISNIDGLPTICKSFGNGKHCYFYQLII